LPAQTVEKTVILAQASRSHLSESIRNPPRLSLEFSLKRRAPILY